MQLTIKATHLTFVNAAKLKTRYANVMQGIHLQPNRIIGTNGFRLAISNDPYEGEGPTEPVTIKFDSNIPARATGSVLIDFDAGVAKWANGKAVTFEVLTTPFPDFDRVTPTGETQFTTNTVPLDLSLLASIIPLFPDSAGANLIGEWLGSEGSTKPMFVVEHEACWYMQAPLLSENIQFERVSQ